MQIQEKIELLGKIEEFFRTNRLQLKVLNSSSKNEIKILQGNDGTNIGKVVLDYFNKIDHTSFKGTKDYLISVVDEDKKKEIINLKKLINKYPDEGERLIKENLK